jgi:dethiobiotin synthetase
VRNGVFITGTGTDVGKTVVTRALARALSRRGLKIAAVKPVESGIARRPGEKHPTDAAALRAAAGSIVSDDDICAYLLDDPVSPHLAAARQGVRIDPARIGAMLERASTAHDLVLAEASGGLLVPLSGELLYADLIAKVGLPLVVVAPNALGAINATLLTLEAARSRGIEVLGVVLSGSPKAELGNAEAIGRFGRTRLLGLLPTVVPPDDERLADAAEAHLDLDVIAAYARPQTGRPA